MYSIDFYLPEFTCYIQFDGVSWHGLNDRRSQNAKYNRIVTQKFKTDRALDTLTPLCNLRLIRVTDLWYKAHRSEAATVVRDLAQDTTWVGVRYVGEHFDFLRSA